MNTQNQPTTTDGPAGSLALDPRSAPAHPDCQLNVEPFFQCCCTCKYRVPAYRRWPWWIVRTLQILRLPRLPLFMPGKQWACVAYDLSHVETHWPEHSCGCEMHTPSEVLPNTEGSRAEERE